MTALESAPAGPLDALRSAHSMLESAAGLDEVKAIRDQAESLRTYCQAASMGLAMQNRCARLKLDAERKAGEMLAVMPKKANQHVAGTTMVQAGISRNQSSRWQRVASLPEDKYDRWCDETTAGLGRDNRSPSVAQVEI